MKASRFCFHSCLLILLATAASLPWGATAGPRPNAGEMYSEENQAGHGNEQSKSVAAESRAARVEKGLLPGIVLAGQPLPTKTLAERMAATHTPGVSIAVINGGIIEWAKGYGVAETGAETPVTHRTLFQAASVSKPVASLAALRLVEQGKLALNEDVNSRLLSWKIPENDFTRRERVTLGRLLSHTAGLTVHGFGGYPADVPVPTLVEILDGQKPANSAAVRVDILPGSLMRYSGGGFTVMQQLLIDVTGQPFPSLISDLVLKPLGMKDSTYEQPLPPLRRKDAASGHRPDGQMLPGRYHTYPEMAAAGLWTTPTDLARFLIEVQRARQGKSEILKAETARRMTTVQKDGYGLGLSIDGTGPAARFGHGGSNEGFKCAMTAFLDGGRGAVVMTNGDQGSRLAAEVFRAVGREYDWPALQPRPKTVVRVDRTALAALEGRYEIRPGHTIAVVLKGETLFIIDRDERIELYPESATHFFELVEETDIEFIKGTDGDVSHLVINGQLKAKRIAEIPGN